MAINGMESWLAKGGSRKYERGQKARRRSVRVFDLSRFRDRSGQRWSMQERGQAGRISYDL
jgi:hypothetical protein